MGSSHNEATGLTIEGIQAEMAVGITLAELLETNGGDVTAVHAELVDELSNNNENNCSRNSKIMATPKLLQYDRMN